MHIKLSYKLFGAFFLILAIVVGAMVFSRYLFYRNFRNYIHQVELEKLKDLVPILTEEYRTQGSWEGIQSNQRQWQRLLGMEMHTPPPPGDRPPPDVFGPSMDMPPPDSPGPPEDRPPPYEPEPPQDRPHGKPMDIVLLDARYQPIIGDTGPDDRSLMVPIDIDGQRIGWLGLQKRDRFKTGPPAALLKRQTRHLVILSSIVIGLTAFIAFLFSRHLLKPIQRLTISTQELANRNFKVRIDATTRDELGQLAENFNTMAQTLENYESIRRQWLTDISHELRTPLAVLRGEIEALQDGVREPTSDNLASLHGEIVRISKLVDDLHATSITDSEKLSFKKERIYPGKILKRILESHVSRFNDQQIALRMDPDNLPAAPVMGDADRLGQVFTNILDNACKYVQSPGTLTLSGKVKDRFLTLYFQDSGPGVPDEALPRLFDRLYRVDTSRNRESGGSGLGLSICLHIIEHHNGRIWAEKNAMGGLTFIIRLPMDSEA